MLAVVKEDLENKKNNLYCHSDRTNEIFYLNSYMLTYLIQ